MSILAFASEKIKTKKKEIINFSLFQAVKMLKMKISSKRFLQKCNFNQITKEL